MPKAKEFNAAYQVLKNHLPRGMFSTLDELIAAHPAQKATMAEWSNYLKPGQTLTREGVSFPLKQEELDYTGLSKFFQNMDERNRDVMIEAPNLQNMIRRQRPTITQRPNDRPKYEAYSHNSQPGSARDYEESLTKSLDFGDYPTHFSPDALSWARTTSHTLPGGEKLRLIDEIQSDRHAAAAEKMQKPTLEQHLQEQDLRNKIQDLKNYLDHDMEPVEKAQMISGSHPLQLELKQLKSQIPTERQGYRTPEEEEILKRPPADLDTDDPASKLNFLEYNRLVNKPPDAPFKGAADYGLLEMKNQLLNAVDNDQDYLGLVRGKDQIERYHGLKDEQQRGMEYGYDKVYKGALEKLGRQYGAPMTEVETQIPELGGRRDGSAAIPASFEEHEVNDLPDFMEMMEEHPDDTDGYIRGVRGLLADYAGLQHPLAQSERYQSSLRSAHENLDAMQALNNEAGTEMHGNFSDDWQSRWENQAESLGRHLFNLDDHWFNAQSSGEVVAPGNKKFPAIQLTPEVKEKVRKAGVPIWQLGGTLAGGDVVKQALDSQEDTPDPSQGFAEGGEVDSGDDSQSTLAQLRAYMDRVPGEDSESDAQYAAPIASFFKGNAIDDTLSMGAHTLGAMTRPWNGSDMNSAYAQSLKNVADYFTGVGDRASDRADERTKKVRHELGVGEPKTLMNKLAAAAGETTTMLPLPESAVTRLGKVGHLSEMAGLTIDPKHYPLWTGINGAIGELPESLDWLAKKLRGEPLPKVAHQDSSDAPTVDFMKEQGYFKGGEARMNKQCGGLTYATGGVVPPRAINDSGLIASQTPGVPVGSSAGLTPAAASTTGIIGGRGIANPAMFPNSGRIIIPQPQNTGMTVGGTPAYQPIPIPGHGSTPGSVPAGSLGGNGPNGPNLLTNGTSSDGSGGDPYAQARARLARLFHSPYRNPNGYAGGGPVDGGTLQTVKHVYHRVHSGEQELSEGISDLMSQLDIDADQARAALNALHQSGYQPTTPSAQTEEMPTTG